MKKLVLLCSALLALLLAACAPQQTAETATQASGDGPVVTVYHPPT